MIIPVNTKISNLEAGDMAKGLAIDLTNLFKAMEDQIYLTMEEAVNRGDTPQQLIAKVEGLFE